MSLFIRLYVDLCIFVYICVTGVRSVFETCTFCSSMPLLGQVSLAKRDFSLNETHLVKY